ncbi:MAG TPA: aminotransferase class IV [Bryobacteraceae bacterium]|jgi:branched-chain amino acid aminotransferase|nr:aminotransferase class IV [Bryobacteraceae bacterium]
MHRYYLHNGNIRETTEAGLFPGQLGLLSGWGVFTTLRVADGALFAWERHWARMSRDAQMLNVEMPANLNNVERDLIRLIEANHAESSTLRLVVVRNTGGFWEGPSTGRASDTIALTAASRQWGDSVRLAIQPNSRYAACDFTRAKVLTWGHNLRWYERAHEQGFDEVILLNEFGRVAECTSANVFAVFGQEVLTPPIGEGCLPGITREVLLEIRVPGISVVERALSIEDLYRADEVFITSTTRGLLPVREIAGRVLTERSAVRGPLLRAFDAVVVQDIARRKNVTVNA